MLWELAEGMLRLKHMENELQKMLKNKKISELLRGKVYLQLDKNQRAIKEINEAIMMCQVILWCKKEDVK